MDTTFDPQTLADDLSEVHRIYARFFTTLDETSWDKPVKGGSKEWTLHEPIEHPQKRQRTFGRDWIRRARRASRSATPIGSAPTCWLRVTGPVMASRMFRIVSPNELIQ